MLIRLFASLQYSWLMSIPMYLRLSSCAATQVVPLPHMGSKTIAPSLVHDLIWSAARLKGNGAGCSLASWSIDFLPKKDGK